MKRTLALLLCIVSLCSSLSALEVKEGRMKIVLYEDSGRFNLYWLQDVSKGSYLPLLFERDPRTTSLTVLADNKMYRMGESSDFRIGSQKLPDGAALVFRSSFLVVTETFTFIRSSGSTLSDGVRYSITVENVSEKDLSVGMRLVLDTYLGEKSSAHFVTASRPKVSTETLVNAQSQDQWIESPSPDDPSAGFMVMQRKDDPLSPDSFILANWSRIDSSPWEYDFNQTRNFTLQPYSINDSAIGATWNIRSVPRAGKREGVLLMGNENPSGFSEAATGSPTANLFDSAVLAGSDKASKTAAVQMDLLAVRDLLENLDAKIASGQATPDELAVLRQILDSLASRKKAY